MLPKPHRRLRQFHGLADIVIPGAGAWTPGVGTVLVLEIQCGDRVVTCYVPDGVNDYSVILHPTLADLFIAKRGFGVLLQCDTRRWTVVPGNVTDARLVGRGVLIVPDSDVALYERQSLIWTTEVATDELRIVQVSEREVTLTGWSGPSGGDVTVTLEVATGRVIARHERERISD